MGLCGYWSRAWARILVADFGCGFWYRFWCGFWVRILVRILGRILQPGVRILGVDFLLIFCRRRQTAEPCISKKIPQKSTPKIQPPFRTSGEGFGMRLSAGRHPKRSEAWVGALGLDKVAGLGCSSVRVLCLYYSLCFKFCDSRQRNIPNRQKIRKNRPPGPKSIQGFFFLTMNSIIHKLGGDFRNVISDPPTI